jgi:restriction system protein
MPRRARKSDSGFIGPTLPWWVLLILAAVTFAGFHLLAGMDAKATTPAGIIGGRYFETLGFRSKVARKGADGGVDIHLYAAGSNTPGILVQCKAWKAYPVGIKPIRELLGVMTAARVAEGVFITTGEYTSEARQFAAQNNIHLIDGGDFLRKIQAVPADCQRSLLEIATAGDFTTPTCPSCGIKMVNRVAQKSGERFWGCTGYPRCRRTFRQAQS